MDIRFLNHSSFLLRSGPVNLLVDPWFDGRVFLDGWELLCPTPFTDADFSGVTHIWMSHEHPDHFHPATLKRIPTADRERIVVLFPHTPDGRVVKYLRAQGFTNVVEMSAGQKVDLGGGVVVQCALFGEIDSWLYVLAEGKGILNTNDCGMRTRSVARDVRKLIDGPIDVLLTQFSYAYWVGNPDQKSMRAREAARKLGELKMQVEEFRPRQLIPVASYIWFCHQDNFHLNDSINTPRAIFDAVRDQGIAEPVILFPGDVHTPLASHDSAGSLARYEELWQRTIRPENCVRGQSLDPERVRQSAAKFLERLHRLAPWWLARFLRPTTIHVSDWNRCYSLSPTAGFLPSDAPASSADISCSSECLDHCFRFSWGIDTLGICGRYQRPAGGDYARFYRYFRFDLLHERGIQVGPRYVAESLVRKALARVGLHAT